MLATETAFGIKSPSALTHIFPNLEICISASVAICSTGHVLQKNHIHFLQIPEFPIYYIFL